MLKYVMLLLLLCAAGCQTTGTGESSVAAPVRQLDRSEKLLLRIEKIVGTYEVVVQRAALTGNDPKQIEDWAIVGSASASGYPGTFRTSEDAVSVNDSGRTATYLLDGEPVKVSHEPGVHLIVKVIPELQNTARVLGVYVQVTQEGDHLESFSFPIDISCNLGEVLQLYSKELPVASMETAYDLIAQMQ
ncbi:hypothetical protein P4B35_06550 [Pontiellaceae bacterium B12227]|nr:hypothetical protein [Pontiellaceae bacterium B12227]